MKWLMVLLPFSLVFSSAFLFFHSPYTEGRTEVVSKTQLSNAVRDPVTEIYDENGCPVREHPRWIVGRAIGCERSPGGRRLGRFVYNGLSFPDRYYELFVKDLRGDEGEHRIYAGDFRTLGWEWLNDDQVVVVYNCGSACQATRITGVEESILISDYGEGEMNEENGWKVNFFNTLELINPKGK